MKNILLAASLLVVFGAAFGSPTAGAGQKAPMVGGYKAVATDDSEVKAAAEFAVAAEGKKENNNIKLLSVESAERQTVAGTNYRLCLKVEVEDTENNVDVTQSVKTVVYKNLKKEYTLTSWEEDDCAGDD